jgi:transcriptional regulator with XRE-family HTH domain
VLSLTTSKKEKTMNDEQKAVGTNIKVLREKYNYTQTNVANFLGLNDHVTISYYETGERNIPIEHLTKIADLFCVDLETLFETDPAQQKINKICAFRKEELKEKDFNTIADFHRIIKNYIKLLTLEKKHAHK